MEKIYIIIILIIFLVIIFLTDKQIIEQNENFSDIESILYKDNENNGNEENNCQYVSSRGILKICDVKPIKPVSGIIKFNESNYNLDRLRDGSIVYVQTSALPSFINYLNNINNKIILVTGDSTKTVYKDIFNSEEEFKNFIESDKIIRWFAQNCTVSHPKLFKIPLGMDYHTPYNKNKIMPTNFEKSIIEIKNNSKSFNERIIKAYANFHFVMNTRFGPDRVDVIQSINPELIYYEPKRTKWIKGYITQSKYAFVLSPLGQGLDCHRTWEALVLGCIPIVKSSGLDDLFIDLPVLIVNNWSDVTKELMEQTIKDFSTRNFNYDKLNLNYWMSQIKVQ